MCFCLYQWLWSHQHQLHLCKVKLKTMYMCNYVKFTVKLINSYKKKFLKKKKIKSVWQRQWLKGQYWLTFLTTENNMLLINK